MFRSLSPIEPSQVVRGQYEGYRDEPGVRAHSETETFVALRCEIDNWRWAGVPFYLRTGKRMAEGARIISIAFREPPKSMFPSGSGVGAHGPDHLTFDLADASRLSLSFYGKRPGPGMTLDKQSLQFALHETGRTTDLLEAYERLIYDAMSGDHTLFTSSAGRRAVVGALDPASGEPPAGPAVRAGIVGTERDPPADRARRVAPPLRTRLAQQLARRGPDRLRPWRGVARSSCGSCSCSVSSWAAVLRRLRVPGPRRYRARRYRFGAPASGPQAARDSTTTSSTMPGQAPSPGCAPGAGRATTGARTRQVTTGGAVHPYLLSVPADYSPSRPAPLVLLFHGYGSDGRSMATLTRMPAQGSDRGVVVVAPDGPDHTWQLSGTGRDAAFVDAIVATVTQSLCIDLHRVYAAGFSQGAAFAIFYSCARPDRIAALATVAVDFQLGCKEPVPYLAFHGTADPAVPYGNGQIGASLPGKVRGTLLNLGDWAELDRCAPTPVTRAIGREIVVRTWTRCAAGTTVQLYTIVNGSHTWPGADPKASPLYTTREIDATALMLDFFAAHGRLAP